jgi:molybdopterin molybdotransferase
MPAMISVEDALKAILENIRELPAEKIFITDACGRCLAEDVISSMDVPACDNSAMDGYAVRLEDIKSIPVKLKVSQDIPAGTQPQSLEPGTAAKIMTGAGIPKGADAVVMREETKEAFDAVEILIVPKLNEHIRFAGEDIKKGKAIIKKGTILNPAYIGLLASIKKSLVYCYRRPRVAIRATGNEIADLDEELSTAKIMSSNTYSLLSLIKETGAEPINLGIAKDDKEHLQACLNAAAGADLILTSGGVSVGDYDLTKEVLSSPGNSMSFWKVAMKPGKPLAFGHVKGIPAIGLPGNPVSSVVSFYKFARPAILKMMGHKNLQLPRIRAKLGEELRKKTDRTHYIRGIVTLWPEVEVMPSGDQGSGILSTTASSNCLIVLPAGLSRAEKGSLVECEIINPLTL